MCPPSRSPARSGSSRLTASPVASGPSELRRSVSSITSAEKPSRLGSTAVRQTPLTATESPGSSSPASSLRTRRRTPPPSRSSDSTVPVPATSPVNTSPIPEAGDDQDVVVDALGLDRRRALRRGDLLDADALDGRLRLGPAEQQRRHEHARLVDLARLEEGASEVRSALEQERLDVALTELVERVRHARRLVRAGRDDHVDVRVLERLHRGVLGGARADDRERHLGHAADELRVERQG